LQLWQGEAWEEVPSMEVAQYFESIELYDDVEPFENALCLEVEEDKHVITCYNSDRAPDSAFIQCWSTKLHLMFEHALPGWFSVRSQRDLSLSGDRLAAVYLVDLEEDGCAARVEVWDIMLPSTVLGGWLQSRYTIDYTQEVSIALSGNVLVTAGSFVATLHDVAQQAVMRKIEMPCETPTFTLAPAIHSFDMSSILLSIEGPIEGEVPPDSDYDSGESVESEDSFRVASRHRRWVSKLISYDLRM